MLTWAAQATYGKLCLPLQGALLPQTCRTDDKVQPRVIVGSWQQERQMAKLGAVWLCSQSGVLLFDLSCPPIRSAPLQFHIVDL